MPNRLTDLLSFKKFRGTENLRDTIEELIEDTCTQGSPSLEDEEKKLLTNVIRLHEHTAKDILIPRAEIRALSTDMLFDEVVSLFIKTEHARMPVYEGTLDNIIGYVQPLDLLKSVHTSETMDLRQHVRDILFIAPSMRLLDLMMQMRETKTPLAIVVDEYGDVDGLITIWDVVREVVGDVSIEQDEEGESYVTKLSDGSFVINARMMLEDFEAICGPLLTPQERDEEDLETVGGLVTFLAGHVPTRRELISHASGISFEILEADPRRVIRVRVRPVKKKPDQNHETV